MKEAERENVSVSNVERKMLYFSEQFDTLPDMSEASDEFDKSFETYQYERKISKLIRQALKQDRKESPELLARWRKAIRTLGREDHYLSVMLDQARVKEHISGHRWREWVWQLAIVAAAFVYIFLRRWFLRLGDRLSPQGRIVGWIVIIAVFALLYRVGPRLIEYFAQRKSRKIGRSRTSVRASSRSD